MNISRIIGQVPLKQQTSINIQYQDYARMVQDLSESTGASHFTDCFEHMA